MTLSVRHLAAVCCSTLLLGLGACSQLTDIAEPSSSETSAEAAEPVGTEPADTEPQAAEGDLAFASVATEAVTFEIDDVFDDVHAVTAHVPVGWEKSEFVGTTFTPPSDGGFGFFTDLSFNNGCNGVCEAQNWADNLNGPDGLLTRARENSTVLRDESIPGGWLLVVDGEITRNIKVVRWNDDQAFYFTCEAELDQEDHRLEVEMVDLCLAADPHWID